MRKQSRSTVSEFTELLPDYIKEQLTESRYYELLAGKLHDSSAEQYIKKIAIEKLLNAQRLTEFYKKQTNKRYQQDNRELPKVIIPPVMQALAERFISEGNSAGRYQRAAKRTGNQALRELFYTLYEQDSRHADILRTVMRSIKEE